MLQRSGARIGDCVVVTGTIGDAALGLKLRHDGTAARRWKLDARMRRHLASRYLLPQPRNVLADALRSYRRSGVDADEARALGFAPEARAQEIPVSAWCAMAMRLGGKQA